MTITITATILPSAAGATVSNQGTIAFDADGNGTNEKTVQTDDPGQPGAQDPTSFAIARRNSDPLDARLAGAGGGPMALGLAWQKRRSLA